MKTFSQKARKRLVTFSFMVCIIVVGGMAVYYQYMKKQQLDAAVQTPTTEVEKLIAKDLTQGYPETPTEVMKLWGRMNQCIYNSSLEESEMTGLFKQLRCMYSSQLLAQNQEDAHKKKLLTEVEKFREKKSKIVSYSAETGTSVKYKTINNQECAQIRISYFINNGGTYQKSFQSFILVKENGKWKILGFQEANVTDSSKKEATTKSSS